MGIIVKEIETGEITFYEKGADVVMMTIVQYNDWLEEETGNMAREGLRTLVVGKKVLSEEQYQVWSSFALIFIGWCYWVLLAGFKKPSQFVMWDDEQGRSTVLG